LELDIHCRVVQLELNVLCCDVQLELDHCLVNSSIKALILTTAFCESNPSLAILVVRLHVIFFHTYRVAIISLLKLASIVALGQIKCWSQNQGYQQDEEGS
jgi:hypothetical protein